MQNAKLKPKTVYSKLSIKSQTVLPREVRERLQAGPGDRLRYILDDKGVRVEKVTELDSFDPFASFTEWASEEDEAAFANL